MDSTNGHHTPAVGMVSEPIHGIEEFITIDQLHHLVRLLGQSDISELEVKYTEINARLILRKPQSSDETTALVDTAFPSQEEDAPSPIIRYHTITAPFVGIFHFWSKPKEPLQVTVGDPIREGQHIGIIQSLDIPNEVESAFAGRVAEVLVEDSQPVEYGQPLLTIEAQ